MKPKIGAIVQARMGSTRLPGKSMADTCGKPLIKWVFERLAKSKTVTMAILATTTDEEDRKLVEFAEKAGIPYFAGHPTDVLDRYYQTSKKYHVEIIVRITGDCPLIDPEVVDVVVNEFTSGWFDYVSNINPPTYPDGLDVEVFSFASLEKAWEKATKRYQREHVTPYLRENPSEFRQKNVKSQVDLSGFRWTVDHSQDLVFVRNLCRLMPNIQSAGYMEILAFLQAHPEIQSINSKIKRNEKYLAEMNK